MGVRVPQSRRPRGGRRPRRVHPPPHQPQSARLGVDAPRHLSRRPKPRGRHADHRRFWDVRHAARRGVRVVRRRCERDEPGRVPPENRCAAISPRVPRRRRRSRRRPCRRGGRHCSLPGALQRATLHTWRHRRRAKGASNARPALNTASDECDEPHGQRRNVPRDGRHHAAHDRLRRSPAHASPSRRETWQPSRRAVVFTRRRAAARSSGFRRCAPVCTRHATDAAPNLGVHQWLHTHDGRQARRRRSTRRRRPNVGCSARTRRTPNAGLARAHAGTNQQHIKSTAPRAPATVAHSVCSCSACAGAFTLVCAVNKASRRSQRTLRTPRKPKALGVTRSVTPRRSDRASTPASPRTRPRG